MIHFLRKLILEDFWLKLFSLALAVLIWFTVSFASRRELGTEKRILPNLPVRVVASAEDVHNFRVSPGQVEITVQGDPYLIRNLRGEDVLAMVDLTGVATARDLRKQIRVSVPPGVTCVRITPDEAQVIFPPSDDSTVFMSAPKKIFGTDGVRGRANTEPVTAETALKLGRAAGHVFKTLESQPRGHGRHKIVLGKDTRLSGYMLENALSAGILSMGVDVLFIGPLPTPGVAYVTRSLRADAGIVITASHNPYDDNGIKFFRSDGYKLDDKIEYQIESLVFSGEIENIRPTADAIGKAVRIDDALGRYIEYAKASFPRGMTLEGLRIVLDCAHGAAYKSTPCVLRELGAEVIVYGNQPDGKNINKECGSMHPNLMCQKIWEHRADLGIAHDGDADRVLLCDEKGALIDGDDIMAIAGLDLLAQGALTKKTVVSTVMSNAGLEAAVREAGGRVVHTEVGDRKVIDEMLRHGYNFGGEQSGHTIFRDFSTTGDGLVTALQVLRIMRAKEQPLSKLAQCWTRFPQMVTNIRVREKRPFEQMDGVGQLLKDAEAELKPQGGRVFLRYSGTESKARLLLEGRDRAALEKWTSKIAEVIKRAVGDS